MQDVGDSPYPILLSPWRRGRLRLKNRIIHASMTTRRVVDSRPTQSMIQYYANRAAGGAAAVITEPLNSARIQTRAHYVQVWNDENVDGLQRWAAAVEQQDCRLLGQIQDSGRGRHERGRNPHAIGASALPDDLSWTVPHVLDIDAIRRMIDDIGSSSARLERCGFSGVEISAGHGHLFHQFMSPWSNQRTDLYGGDFAGRLRLLDETISAIRAACSADFVIGLKLPGDDGIPGSIDPALAESIARAITRGKRVDYVAFAQGTHARTLDWHIPDMHWPRSAWMPLIDRLKGALVDTPLVALGLITDPAEAEGILNRGQSELVAVGRVLITDPAWPLKAAQGRAADIRYCVSCNTCWGQIVDHHPLSCDNNPRVAMTDEVDWYPVRATHRKRIVVVGAGIAGLEAAWIAAARGHDVVVFGASLEVGGKTRLHASLPGGESLSSIYDYQFAKARQSKVRLELGFSAGVDDILALQPDTVVLATGSTMYWPRTLPQTWQAEGAVPDIRELLKDLIGRDGHQGGVAVVFDMDHTEATYAGCEYLEQRFDRVLVVTPRDRIAADVPLVSALGIQRRFAKKRISVAALAELSPMSNLEEGIVSHVNIHSGHVTSVENVTLLTYSTPRIPNDALFPQLTASGVPVHSIGDCYAPRTVLAATSDGHRVGNLL